MFKKSDPWESGLKMVSKFLGFDVDEDNQNQRQSQVRNIPLSLKSSSEQPVSHRTQQKSYQLKQKWKKLMKFPSKIKYIETIQLLREGSAMQDETWVWMFKNTQKISPQLYTSKKQQLHRILYPKNPLGSKNTFTEMHFQIQDFEQPLQFKLSVKQSINIPKKRKVSITKSGIFIKNQSSLTGRTSVNSQASTYSCQTHNSNQIIQPQCKRVGFMLDNLLCSKFSQFQSPERNHPMKSSYMSNCSISTNQPVAHQENYSGGLSYRENSLQSDLYELPSKINHPALTNIIGAFLLHREDFTYSVTLFNMAATFYYYTNSSQMKTFILLNHVACSQFFMHYLTKDTHTSAQFLQFIAHKIRQNCPSTAFLKYFRLQNFIQNWLYGFFYSICQNGSKVKQNVIGYLLINGFSIDSIIRVCQSLVYSLSKIINQGYEQKIYECLQNPKIFIDNDVLFDHLLQCQQ